MTRTSALSMEFWIGVGFLTLVWWVLGRPGASLELAREGMVYALVFACTFCVCRTFLKAVSLWSSKR